MSPFRSRPSPDRPAPVPSRLYSAALLETFAAGEHTAFLAAGGRPLRPRLARSLALANLRPGLVVVDIGCGRGEAAAHAARRGAEVLAVDYSPGSLALTRETAAVMAPAALESDGARGRFAPISADATALPLADGMADRVLLLDVVEHLHRWQLAAALGEVRRILRPRGYVIIHTLPNRWALAGAYPWLRLLAPGLPSGARSDYERAVHVNEQDPLSLKGMLAGAGLDSRVWVEEWTTRHAQRGWRRDYPDALRARSYPLLARPVMRRLARVLMATPARWWVGNDLFALAWAAGGPPPPRAGRFRAVR